MPEKTEPTISFSEATRICEEIARVPRDQLTPEHARLLFAALEAQGLRTGAPWMKPTPKWRTNLERLVILLITVFCVWKVAALFSGQ